MSYNARVFNVMIASPGDVASERAIVRDVVYEWNAVHSIKRNIVLLPVGWESHSSPEMGDSPQEIINKQVLEKCDLLVGIFWTRVGTPTTHYGSGTIEEIEKYITTEKPVMLYFSGKPVVLDSIDTDQIQQLKTFKESCKTRGLYFEYDSLSDFKEIFYHHLQLKINEHPMFNDYDSSNSAEVFNSNVRIPTLSDNAKILLKEASLSSNGDILYLRTLGGTHIQFNDKSILLEERRETARWESAIQELVRAELLIGRGTKGEIYELTNLGYQVAEMIEL